jgi:hypothetical protein
VGLWRSAVVGRRAHSVAPTAQGCITDITPHRGFQGTVRCLAAWCGPGVAARLRGPGSCCKSTLALFDAVTGCHRRRGPDRSGSPTKPHPGRTAGSIDGGMRSTGWETNNRLASGRVSTDLDHAYAELAAVNQMPRLSRSSRRYVNLIRVELSSGAGCREPAQ